MTFKGRKTLVTGASGFTGTALVRALCEAGADVTAIARPSSKLESLAGLPVTWVRGDVFDPATVEKAAAGAEYIFHVAAAYREAGISDDTYRLVHEESTRLLAEAAKRQPGFQRFVHVSTVGVHGHIENPPADENSPFSPGDIYQETKSRAELWIREFARQHAFPITVIRPAAIYGPGDRRLLKLFKLANKPIVPLLGFGKCLYHLIHVEDLVRALMIAATHPAAAGEVFICGNAASVSLKEMVTIIAKESGKTPRFVRIPAGPFFALGFLCEKIFPIFKLEPPIYRRRVAFFTKDRSFDTRKLRNLLDFKYAYTNESGLQATARWYKKAGWM